jgi:predicted ester cyclase
MGETFAGLPDFRPEAWTFIAEGDHVAAELGLTGTHRGTFMGYPPTGRVVRWAASAFYTLSPEHDQVIREVYYYDLLSLTSQLSADGS